MRDCFNLETMLVEEFSYSERALQTKTEFLVSFNIVSRLLPAADFMTSFYVAVPLVAV